MKSLKMTGVIEKDDDDDDDNDDDDLSSQATGNLGCFHIQSLVRPRVILSGPSSFWVFNIEKC